MSFVGVNVIFDRAEESVECRSRVIVAINVSSIEGFFCVIFSFTRRELQRKEQELKNKLIVGSLF